MHKAAPRVVPCLKSALALVCCSLAVSVQAQTLQHSPSGAELSSSAYTLRVDALRPDFLRVRLYPVDHPAEDASWAVLPAARTAHVAVTAESKGFSTSLLRVSIFPDLRLTVTDMGGNLLQNDAIPPTWEGASFKVSKQKTAEDHFFGLGDKPGPLDRSGQSFVMWNTDNFGWQESTDLVYKSIPFFMDFHAGRTLGVLFDNTFRTFFDFGHERTDRYTFSAPGGPLYYYLLYGPEPKQVVESYAWLTGPTPLPPVWALGYQQSRYSYTPQARVEEVASRLRADHIPSDVIWLDIDFQDKNRPFTVDPVTFPDFPVSYTSFQTSTSTPSSSLTSTSPTSPTRVMPPTIPAKPATTSSRKTAGISSVPSGPAHPSSPTSPGRLPGIGGARSTSSSSPMVFPASGTT